MIIGAGAVVTKMSLPGSALQAFPLALCARQKVLETLNAEDLFPIALTTYFEQIESAVQTMGRYGNF